MSARPVSIEINGRAYDAEVEPRLLLSDFIRHEAGLTGTHVGCEHGVCGACTVQLDGEPIRSCLMLAVQADGHELLTVEGIAPSSDKLHPLQEAFLEADALQCGYCTPGMIMSSVALLSKNPNPSELEIVRFMDGNVCRCGTYPRIVSAIRKAAQSMRGGGK